MKVVQAADGLALERNCVYVIPPQAYLAVRDGVLRLSPPPAPHGARLPFDFFLSSLADAFGERAVCVILSGTGADGSVGLKAISEKGGLVIAQDPLEAAYDGMPRSAIATGAVNLVLPVAQIPQALTRYAQHPYVTAGPAEAPSDEVADKSLGEIIELLRVRTSHDFTHYRKATLLRRIRRRMAAAGAKEIDDYIAILREEGREAELLAKDFLIHVTGFFRDPASFEALARTVIPELVQRLGEQPIRVWVPGCSTGEEAYSLAMLFFEEFIAAERPVRLQIFATDVSADAVAFGRNGVYPASIKADVSAQRLQRFFTREDQGYRINRDLREVMVFTVQDLLVDPAFSRIDLVSCRNLLIYLQPDE
jgi:two-component system, chemotaxis family, CheB/CheR fusion protein